MIVYIKIILGCRWTFSFFSSSSLFIFLLPLFLSVSFSNKSRRKRQRGWDRARGIELVTKLLVLKPGETGSLQSRDSRVSLARLLRFSLWGMSTLTQTPRCSCEGLETGIPHSFPTLGGSDLVARVSRKKEDSCTFQSKQRALRFERFF